MMPGSWGLKNRISIQFQVNPVQLPSPIQVFFFIFYFLFIFYLFLYKIESYFSLI